MKIKLIWFLIPMSDYLAGELLLFDKFKPEMLWIAHEYTPGHEHFWGLYDPKKL